jgi:hypothetical protein
VPPKYSPRQVKDGTAKEHEGEKILAVPAADERLPFDGQPLVSQRHSDALAVNGKEPYEITEQVASQNARNAIGPDSIYPQKDGSSE